MIHGWIWFDDAGERQMPYRSRLCDGDLGEWSPAAEPPATWAVFALAGGGASSEVTCPACRMAAEVYDWSMRCEEAS